MKPTRSGVKKPLNPIVALLVLVGVAIIVVVVFYYFQKPKPSGGSYTVLSRAAVEARRRDQKIWEEEQQRARAEGRQPDYSKMPKLPSAYMNEANQPASRRGPAPVTGR